MTRVIINLCEDELRALFNLAESEYRDTRQQAAFLIRQELERRGLLTINDPPRVEALSSIPPKEIVETY